MRSSLRFVLAVAMTLGFTVPSVFATTITFTTDTTGAKPNGFVSSGSALASFTDTLGANLDVRNFFAQSDGNALAVNGDDASQLRIDFTTYMGSLQIDFGNDDP